MKKKSDLYLTSFLLLTAISLILLIFSVPGPACAGWLRTGPEGANVTSFAADPVNSQVFYAGTQGGLYKSQDSGATWSSVSSKYPALRYVNTILIDPVNPITIYAGTLANGVLKTTDGGVSWIQINVGLLSLSIESLALDPTSPQTIYAGTTFSGLFKSVNGGMSWFRIDSGFTSIRVQCVAVDPKRPGTLFVGVVAVGLDGQGGGIYKSSDGGMSWTPANNGMFLFWKGIISFAINPVNPDIIYVLTDLSIYKSTNGGKTWLPTSGLISSIRSMAINSANPEVLYAGDCYGGIYRSVDAGNSWIRFNSDLPRLDVEFMAVDPFNSERIYACNRRGVFKSSDSGLTWSFRSSGMKEMYIYSVLVDPLNPQTIYVTTGDAGGVFKSVDGGANWDQINSGLSSSNSTPTFMTIAADQSSPQNLYAAAWGGSVYKSTNGGIDWVQTSSGVLYCSCLAIDNSNPDIIYIGTTYGTTGVIKTTDGGLTWNRVGSGYLDIGVNALAIDPVNPSIIYAATSQFIFKSTDGGASWIQGKKYMASPRALVIDTWNTQVLYAGDALGIWKSYDGGTNWSMVNSTYFISSLKIDPINSNILYAGAMGSLSGLLVSSNSGRNWGESFYGIPVRTINSLAMTPELPHTFYAGTYAGVFKYTNKNTDPVPANGEFGLSPMFLLLSK